MMMNSVSSQRGHLFRFSAIAMLSLTAAALVACGGGSEKSMNVTNVNATNLSYGSRMTVTVNGSGLDNPDLTVTVSGPCGTVTRGTATDSQAVFTCLLSGVGEVEAQVRNASGLQLARVKANVPLPQVTMSVTQGTRSGSMVIELDPNAAPLTVRNFISYVSGGFYVNTLFHRVEPGKLAQGGGYNTGPTLKTPTGDPIALESNRGLSNLRGTIAMARAALPATARSEFYFNISDNPEFDYLNEEQPGYAVFGRVVTGLDVLDEIGKVEVQSRGQFPTIPVTEVRITAVFQNR